MKYKVTSSVFGWGLAIGASCMLLLLMILDLILRVFGNS